jgi:hypothetical protein
LVFPRGSWMWPCTPRAGWYFSMTVLTVLNRRVHHDLTGPPEAKTMSSA